MERNRSNLNFITGDKLELIEINYKLPKSKQYFNLSHHNNNIGIGKGYTKEMIEAGGTYYKSAFLNAGYYTTSSGGLLWNTSK